MGALHKLSTDSPSSPAPAAGTQPVPVDGPLSTVHRRPRQEPQTHSPQSPNRSFTCEVALGGPHSVAQWFGHLATARLLTIARQPTGTAASARPVLHQPGRLPHLILCRFPELSGICPDVPSRPGSCHPVAVTLPLQPWHTSCPPRHSSPECASEFFLQPFGRGPLSLTDPTLTPAGTLSLPLRVQLRCHLLQEDLWPLSHALPCHPALTFITA